jgi:hypothetical protein
MRVSRCVSRNDMVFAWKEDYGWAGVDGCRYGLVHQNIINSSGLCHTSCSIFHRDVGPHYDGRRLVPGTHFA